MPKISVTTNNDNKNKTYRTQTLQELERTVTKLENEASRVTGNTQKAKQVLQAVKNTKIEIAKRIK